MICQVCGQENQLDVVGRRDACLKCGADLRACRQCRHYAPGLSNDCREPQVEPVSDKERANFCGFYQAALIGPVKGGATSKDAAQKKWEELFGRKK